LAKEDGGYSEFIAANHGEQGNPLPYVISPNAAVPTETDDPYTGYEMVDIEMITRDPHTGSAYQLDNCKVWEIMKNICGRNPCYIYIKDAAKSKDGREEFCMLFDHYIGTKNVGSLATAAEERLQSTRYSGDKRNFNFEKYVRIHTKHHSVLNGLIEHCYSRINQSSKVRLILDGITTRNYGVVKSQVLASPALKTRFEKSVELYKELIKSTKKEEHRNVSAVHVKSRQTGKSGGGAVKRKATTINGAPEDKFYSREQYMSLSDDQKEALRQTGLASARIPIGKKGKTLNNGSKSNKAVIAALTARLDATVTAKENEGQGTAKCMGNRDNDALRQRPRGPGE
jgi:hypothetical protein